MRLFSDEDPIQDIKKAILQHEDTFRHQLLELHRVYWTQKNLMNDFPCNDLGDHADLHNWGSMRVQGNSMQFENEYSPFWAESRFWNPMLYHDGQRSFHTQIPMNDNGYQQGYKHPVKNGFICNQVMTNPQLELSLGFVDSSNQGKGFVARSFTYKDGFNNQKVIDLDNSVETVGNEEDIVVPSLSPKTPIIFSEARHDCKQTKCDVWEKTRKHVDCGQSSDPLIAGQDEIHVINSEGKFVEGKGSLDRTSALFDLNICQPEEPAFPVCELDVARISVIQMSTVESAAYLGNVQSNSISCLFGKAIPKTMQQQSSDGSSPFSCLDSCTPSSKNEDFLSEQLVQEVANTQTFGVVESAIISCRMNLNDESIHCTQSSEKNETEELEPFLFEEKSTNNNSCHIRCNGEFEHPVLAFDSESNMLCLDSKVNASSSSHEESIICEEDCDILKMQSCSDNNPCNEEECTLKGSEEFDHAILMASTSLVHMSLELSFCCHSVDVERVENQAKKAKLLEQPQCSVDSLECIVLTLPENRELECSSPFKPMEESTMNSKSRYSSRSGRQLRDFQKDILPGIVALSRHEICEDMHAFTEIIRSGEVRRKGLIANFGRGNRCTIGRGRRPRKR